MITCKPVDITMAMLTSSTVPYPDTGETLFSPAVSYSAGATVSFAINGIFHRFESKQGSNLAHTPQAYPDDAGNAWWIDLGYVNKLAAFQRSRNTQTVATSPYTVKIAPLASVGVIGIGNTECDTVTLNVYDATNVLVKTKTIAMNGRDVYNWTTWTFAPFDQIVATMFSEVPMNSTNSYELTFTRASGLVKVGFIIMGMPVDIGRALMGGAGISMLNFSTFERDEFGESKVTVRRNVPKVNYQLRIAKAKLNNVIRVINKLNGEVTLWAGVENAEHGYFENTFVIGMAKDFRNVIDQPNFVSADIEIEAL